MIPTPTILADGAVTLRPLYASSAPAPKAVGCERWAALYQSKTVLGIHTI